ncbi:MAG: carboxypeptidase-like regulatory domain-containing protein, partial [Bacteroidales bacterium]
MKKYLSLLIFTGTFLLGHSQVITIKDKENHQPLELVTLSSESPHASAITNARGQADITFFKGSAHIEIRILGYSPVFKSYQDLEKAGFQVYMSQSTISLDQVVVSATRWSQLNREVPAKITSISSK